MFGFMKKHWIATGCVIVFIAGVLGQTVVTHRVYGAGTTIDQAYWTMQLQDVLSKLAMGGGGLGAILAAVATGAKAVIHAFNQNEKQTKPIDDWLDVAVSVGYQESYSKRYCELMQKAKVSSDSDPNYKEAMALRNVAEMNQAEQFKKWFPYTTGAAQ
jgi:hypothetical protein